MEAGGWSLMKHGEGVLTTGLRAKKGTRRKYDYSLALQTLWKKQKERKREGHASKR